MGICLGFYRPTPELIADINTRARAGDISPDPKLVRLVVELPEKLPASCKIVAAYNPQAGNVLSDPGPPGILIVDTNNTDDLFVINRHYAGYLQFQWTPATSVGATRQEREASMAAAGAVAGARR